MTVHTHCPGGCGQPLLWPTDDPELCAHCASKVIPAIDDRDCGWDGHELDITSLDVFDAPGGKHIYSLIFNDDGTTTCVPATEPPPARLYGEAEDEVLHRDIEDAIENAADRAWTEETAVGESKIIEVVEYSVMAKGESPSGSIPGGRDLAERVVELFWEDCGFEDAYEDLYEAASQPDVVTAFQEARDLLVSKQKFSIAEDIVATHKFKITMNQHGTWDSEPAS